MFEVVLVALIVIGQGSASPGPGAGDTARIVRDAQRTRTAFERLRRRIAPVVDDGGGSGDVCPRRVGRLCRRDDDDGGDRLREPERLRRARLALIAALDRAAIVAPADEWVAGDRVHYLLEAGLSADAMTAARGCRATRWWCFALEGLALHDAGEIPAAEAAFDEALAAMPDAQRCAWRDIGMLLEGDSFSRYRGLSCVARSSVEARFWWLADPLWSVPGNERRSEHFARRVLARLESHGESPWGMSWGDDLQELTIRYGWPVRWGRSRSQIAMLPADESIIGFTAEPGYAFEPPPAVLASPLAAREDDWALTEPDARTAHASRSARRFEALRPVLTSFCHDDSAIVVAGYDVRGDTALSHAALDAALALSASEADTGVVARLPSAPLSGVLAAVRPSCAPLLASVELRARDGRGVARAREGVAIPAGSGIALSGLLPLTPSDSAPGSLSAALRQALPEARIRRGGALEFYWETYGLAPAGDSLTIEISVLDARGGVLHRVSRSLGLSRPGALGLRWSLSAVPDRGVLAQSVTLDLGALPAGAYRIELRTARGDAAPALAQRELMVDAP